MPGKYESRLSIGLLLADGPVTASVNELMTNPMALRI